MAWVQVNLTYSLPHKHTLIMVRNIACCVTYICNHRAATSQRQCPVWIVSLDVQPQHPSSNDVSGSDATIWFKIEGHLNQWRKLKLCVSETDLQHNQGEFFTMIGKRHAQVLWLQDSSTNAASFENLTHTCTDNNIEAHLVCFNPILQSIHQVAAKHLQITSPHTSQEMWCFAYQKCMR